ncbi:MAG: WD40 repeat domain-containing protein, partial [Mesorhizobium sp.]
DKRLKRRHKPARGHHPPRPDTGAVRFCESGEEGRHHSAIRRKQRLPQNSLTTILRSTIVWGGLVWVTFCFANFALGDVNTDTLQEGGPKLVVQLGHSTQVTAVAISSDGRLLATGGGDSDRTVRLWEVDSGAELHQFIHERGVHTIEFSPDSQYLTTGSSEGARSWEIKTGMKRRLDVSSSVSLDLSDDGSQLLVGGNRTISLFNKNTGASTFFPADYLGNVVSVAISPDGRQIFTGGDVGPAILWDVATRREVRQFGQPGDVNTVAFLPKNQRLVLTAGCQSELRPVVGCIGSWLVHLWNVETGDEVRRFVGTQGDNGVALSPDGRHLLVGRSLWDLNTGNEVRQFGEGFVQAVAFSSDSRWAVTAGFEGTRSWSLETGAELQRFEGRSSGVTAAEFSNDGRRILIGTRDGQALVWDLATGANIERLGEADNQSPSDVRLSKFGNRALAYSYRIDRSIRLWDLETGTAFSTFHGGNQDVFALSPDGSRVLIGTAFDPAAKLLDATNGEVLRKLPDSAGWVQGLAISPDNSKLLTASDTTLELWDAPSGSILQRLVGHAQWISMAVFSADGERALSGAGDGTARLWDVKTGRQILRIDDPPFVQAVAMSHSGATILTGNWDGMARLWSATTGGLQVLLPNHLGRIVSASFSPDDSWVLTGSEDGAVIVSKASSGREVARLVPTKTNWIAVTPAGQFDTGSLEHFDGVHWLMPDDPLRPLSPEIFMRDYFEPNLLGRLLACHEAEASGKNAEACAEAFKPVRSLVSLNRIQPDVRIVSVKAGPTPYLAMVEVEASGKEDTAQKNGKTSTGVFDVRLFRDGQLVGQWPEPKEDAAAGDDLDAWRRASRVVMPAGGKARYTFPVRLAGGARGKKVTFTAYGFNEDRVKSTTATDDSYTVPQDIAVPARPRAYVVTVGVNEYENKGLRLNFAVADAEAIETALE